MGSWSPFIEGNIVEATVAGIKVDEEEDEEENLRDIVLAKLQ